MIAVSTSITDKATPVVLAIARATRPEAIKPVVGRSVTARFRRHLFAVDNAKPNALGGTRTHFYANAARSAHFDVLPDGVMISINALGLRQRVVGGTIKPKTKKFLRIPARAEAHGKRASEFNDLVVVFGAGGQPVALARAGQTKLTRSSKKTGGRITGGTAAGGEILFWLKKSVTQRGDPSVVPQAFEIGAAAHDGINRHVALAVARAQQANAAKVATSGTSTPPKS